MHSAQRTLIVDPTAQGRLNEEPSAHCARNYALGYYYRRAISEYCVLHAHSTAGENDAGQVA